MGNIVTGEATVPLRDQTKVYSVARTVMLQKMVRAANEDQALDVVDDAPGEWILVEGSEEDDVAIDVTAQATQILSLFAGPEDGASI